MARRYGIVVVVGMPMHAVTGLYKEIVMKSPLLAVTKAVVLLGSMTGLRTNTAQAVTSDPGCTTPNAEQIASHCRAVAPSGCTYTGGSGSSYTDRDGVCHVDISCNYNC